MASRARTLSSSAVARTIAGSRLGSVCKLAITDATFAAEIDTVESSLRMRPISMASLNAALTCLIASEEQPALLLHL
jgi:hypothetical protein